MSPHREADTDAALVQQLLAQGERLSPELRKRLLARGAASVPLLVRVLEDEQLALVTAPGEGYAPIHAAHLLVEFGGEQAIRALAHALPRSQPGEVLFDVLLDGLAKRGPAVAAPALEALEATQDADARLGLLSALSRCGAKDERILRHLVEWLETEPVHAAACLADYGDPRAIEPLQRAFDRAVRKPEDSALPAQDVIEIEAALSDLGAPLDEARQALFEQATASRRALSKAFNQLLREYPQPARRTPRPGRNEPCWCGSGVKYKKCHAGRPGG